MPSPLGFNVGRVRVTSAALPSEAGYIRSIREQMKVIIQNVQRVISRIENVTPEALVFGVQPIFDRSQELVPIDTGVLKDSGFIETRPTAAGVGVFVGYARFGKPFYAGFVHERLDVRHAAGKQAKFLEAAVNEKIGTFERRVALFMSRQTGLKR